MVADIKRDAQALIAGGTRPGLATVLVGEDPASAVYVRSKGRLARECGFHSVQHDLAADTSETTLLALVDQLNIDPTSFTAFSCRCRCRNTSTPHTCCAVSIRRRTWMAFTRSTQGLLAIGDAEDAFIPCTPAGCLQLASIAAKALGRTIAGSEAVVLGRSNIVGKPVAQLLLAADATVTMAHSKDARSGRLSSGARIFLIAAVGRAEMVRGAWLKPGAIVIDVGINRVAGPDGKTRLVGDVAYEEALADRRCDYARAGRSRTAYGAGPDGEHAARRASPARKCLKAPRRPAGDDRRRLEILRTDSGYQTIFP